MKKIFFNDMFGQTAAVISETKTMFRQFVPQKLLVEFGHNKFSDKSYELIQNAPYKVGEIVAVAQSYFDIKTSANSYRPPIWKGYKDWHEYLNTLPDWDCAGQHNKMFVEAELMPHRIRIEKVRVERLQDISDADCLAEGIITMDGNYEVDETYGWGDKKETYFTPKCAYAALIDSISGKGTWERNPYVFAYKFKLVK